MDERVMVEVYVPAVLMRLDMVLVTRYPIEQIKQHIIHMVEEASNNAFVANDDTVLYLTRLHCALQEEQWLSEVGLLHGDEIILW